MATRRKRRARALEPGRRTVRALVTLSVLEETELEATLAVEAVRDVESAVDARFEDDLLCLFAESHLGVLSEAGIALEEVVETTERARRHDLPAGYVAIGWVDEQTFLCVATEPSETTAEMYLYDVDNQNTAPVSVGRWLEERIGLYRERLRDGDASEQARADATPSELQLATYRPDMIPEAPTKQKVRHPKFGVGTVLDERGGGESKKLEIEFDDGIRTILEDYVARI